LRTLMKGNDAVSEAAIRAGCRFFSGYPITPQSEIVEYMSWRLDEVGGSFVQSESELSGISMVYGAAACGLRVMSSSSGPGFDLLQEGIGYIVSAELPALIVDVSRYGNGLGMISPGQSDYWQVVKNGAHGDYHCLVFAPASIQEAVDLVGLAYDKAEQYRNPAIMLYDGALGQMMEPIVLPEMKEHDPDQFSWAFKGKSEGAQKQHTSRCYYAFDTPEAYDKNLRDKYSQIEKNEQLWESYMTEDAELIFCAYGIMSRTCKEAINEARKEGIKVGMIRPITLYPYPVNAFKELPSGLKGFISVEMSALGQMVEDVRLAVNGRAPVYNYATGMSIPDTQAFISYMKNVLEGKEASV
jgi:2-oxoglutarate/2-oxoacid ferredoxin oxidoreductase subunit alpha